MAKKVIKKTTVRKPHKGDFQIGNYASCKKWATPELMQKDIDKYFKRCDENTTFYYDTFVVKHTILAPLPYTTEGLCVALDCDRKTLLNYEKQEGYEAYFHTINKAKTKIQLNKIERGHTGESKTAMVIFDLKNNSGYVDKQEIDNPSANKQPLVQNFTVSNTEFGDKVKGFLKDMDEEES